MNQLVTVNQNQLEEMFQTSKFYLNKNYLSELSRNNVVELPQEIEELNLNQHIRLFKLDKLVFDEEENALDKLTNIYTSLGNIGISVVLILDSDGTKTDFYIGAKCTNLESASAPQAEEIIKRTFKGNFPGSELNVLRKKEILPLFEKITESNIRNNETAVSSVSGIPSLKKDESNFIQGLEKIIDAMQGSVYTAIFIADPVNFQALENIKEGYNQIYTRLSPFSKSQLSYGENEGLSVANTLTRGITHSLSESIGKTQSFTEGNSFTEGFSDTEGRNFTEGTTTTNGTSATTSVNNSVSKGTTCGYTTTTSKNTSRNYGSQISSIGGAIGSIVGSIVPGAGNVAGALVGSAIGGAVGGVVGLVAGDRSYGESESENNSTTNTTTEGTSFSEGRSFSEGVSTTHGTNKSYTVNNSTTSNTAQTDTFSEQTSTSEAVSEQEGSSETTSKGVNKNLQIELENRSVKGFLEQIDKQLQRIDSCKNFGMWNCASYFITEDIAEAQVAASTFKSLMRGEDSCVEDSFINMWDSRDKINLDEVKKYLQKLSHPRFDTGINLVPGLPHVTPGSLISGNELAIQLGLPRKSVAGLPVMTMTEFGRNVTTYDQLQNNKTRLGHIHHMGETEKTEVTLDLNSLCMHTFITGSTGSGKSNTIYKLLSELNRKDVKFLVVEPAKGEYKEVFGGRSDVNVYGTNPNYSEMLKINPFTFPEEIHVLEHIDRLIEIFNACWPMYAAMPAVLKEAIELVYERCGWDLEYSICMKTDVKYPTFKELLVALEDVIKSSSYSEELKNNYTGALCTRVKSLTNGLLGRVFATEELTPQTLFDENTIVDLSRIGSVETKALITGILFIKLQEYRMTSSITSNSGLRHVTVLEEAHNLLKRTSTAQSQEGANLQGKSVEMISNSIAEMRTYGEGFIIVDQAPNLLDESVIRNTNTKIILRLPQLEDRESVGKSASLNDKQINEIPKLKTGVAVVYQNNWLEPVLCKVDEFKDFRPLKYSFSLREQFQVDKKMRGDLITLLLADKLMDKGVAKQDLQLDKIDVESLQRWIEVQPIVINQKNLLVSELQLFKEKGLLGSLYGRNNFKQLSQAVSSLFDMSKIERYLNVDHQIDTSELLSTVLPFVESNLVETWQHILCQCLLKSVEMSEGSIDYMKWEIEAEKKGWLIV